MNVMMLSEFDGRYANEVGIYKDKSQSGERGWAEMCAYVMYVNDSSFEFRSQGKYLVSSTMHISHKTNIKNAFEDRRTLFVPSG